MQIKYIAIPADAELLGAIKESCKRSGLKLGPECAMRLRKVFRVGPFAREKKDGESKTASILCSDPSGGVSSVSAPDGLSASSARR